MTDTNNLPQCVDASQDKFNLEDLERFLRFFALDEDCWQSEVHCYCWMTDKAALAGFGIRFSPFEELLEDYNKLLEDNSCPTPHITLNLTKHTGRKKKDIEACRVFCLDLDHTLTSAQLKQIQSNVSPSLIVESSPAKYHCYWKAPAGMGLEEWSAVQAGLAALYDGDLDLSGITHLIRVPGFPRICKDGSLWVPRVVWDDGEHVPKLFGADLYNEGVEALSRLTEQRKEKAKKVKLLSNKNGHFDEKEWQAKARELGDVGKRNDSLYGAVHAFVLGYAGSIDTAGASDLESCAYDFGTRVNDSFALPLADDEAGTCIESAISHAVEARRKKAESQQQKDAANAAKLGEVTEKQQAAQDAGLVYPYDYSAGALLSARFSDSALIERVLQRFGDNLIRTGKLIYAFDERTRTWASDKEYPGTIERYVNTCMADVELDPRFIAELCSTGRGEYSESMARAAKAKARSHATRRNTFSDVMLSGEVRRDSVAVFDAEPFKLLCRNGVLDIVTGEMRQAEAGDYLLHSTGLNWNEHADYAWWEDFLGELFANNDGTTELVQFMREVFGYTLTGSIGEQKIFIHYGEGSNGKSKVLEALALICGSYSTRMGGGTLAKGKNAIQKELDRHGAKIEGKRCVLIDDVDSKTQWNEGLVKNFTSKGIPARKLYEEERDIPNRAKFHLGCNEAPAPESQNYGILRRLCIIHYKRQFEPSNAEEVRIEARMHEFREGILCWAVEGYRAVLKGSGKISYPLEVQGSVEDYRAEHFTTEGALEAIFGAIKAERKEEDLEWRSLQDLSKLVSHLQLSAIALGTMLGNTFGFKSRREQTRGIRTRYYLVPKNLRIPNKLNDL